MWTTRLLAKPRLGSITTSGGLRGAPGRDMHHEQVSVSQGRTRVEKAVRRASFPFRTSSRERSKASSYLYAKGEHYDMTSPRWSSCTCSESLWKSSGRRPILPTCHRPSQALCVSLSADVEPLICSAPGSYSTHVCGEREPALGLTRATPLAICRMVLWFL